MVQTSNFLIDDGIIIWFDGPEWDEVAEQAFRDDAKQVELYAKNNAAWQDRTGDARAGLEADVELANGEVTLVLGHGVEYGYWLEVIQNGRFAIIQQTIEQYAPVVLAHTMVKLRAARQGRN